MKKGKISISKYMNSSDPSREVNISIEDESSNVRFLDVEMSITNFAKAILGQGDIPMLFSIKGIENVGLKREYKTENIRIAHSPYHLTDEVIRNVLDQYEIDGWTARVDDFHNYHNSNHESNSDFNGELKEIWIYKINFYRYVENADA